MELIKKQLLYKFTGSELKTIAQGLASFVEELDKVEAKKQEVNEKFRDEINHLKEQIRTAAKQINTGQEQRLMDCGLEKDYDRNVVRVYRQDDGSMVEERAMTLQERQMGLNMPPQTPPVGPEDVAHQH